MFCSAVGHAIEADAFACRESRVEALDVAVEAVARAAVAYAALYAVLGDRVADADRARLVEGNAGVDRRAQFDRLLGFSGVRVVGPGDVVLQAEQPARWRIAGGQWRRRAEVVGALLRARAHRIGAEWIRARDRGVLLATREHRRLLAGGIEAVNRAGAAGRARVGARDGNAGRVVVDDVLAVADAVPTRVEPRQAERPASDRSAGDREGRDAVRAYRRGQLIRIAQALVTRGVVLGLEARS